MAYCDPVFTSIIRPNLRLYTSGNRRPQVVRRAVTSPGSVFRTHGSARVHD